MYPVIAYEHLQTEPGWWTVSLIQTMGITRLLEINQPNGLFELIVFSAILLLPLQNHFLERGDYIMNTQKKFWLVLIGAVLAMVIIACSCGSLVPTPTAAPQPPAGASMAGKWLDPDTSGTITTIVAQNGGYTVVSVINPDPSRGTNELTKTSWSNGVLTWTYCIPNGNCITSVTVSVNDSNLETTWTDDRGYSGTTTFQRQP